MKRKPTFSICGGNAIGPITFWDQVTQITSTELEAEIPCKPDTLLLNYLPMISGEKRILALHMITAARLVYARFWKQKITPKKSVLGN